MLTPEMVGVPAFIILTLGGTFLLALMRGTLRLGREYNAMETDRDFWRSRAERGTRMAEAATSVADRVLPPG